MSSNEYEFYRRLMDNKRKPQKTTHSSLPSPPPEPTGTPSSYRLAKGRFAGEFLDSALIDDGYRRYLYRTHLQLPESARQELADLLQIPYQTLSTIANAELTELILSTKNNHE